MPVAEQLEELERRLASLLDQALAGQRTAMLDRLRSGLGDLASAVEATALAHPAPRLAASDFAPLADEGSAAGRSGGFLALRDGLARIDAARTQADLLATLLDVATELADRAVVLLARNEGLIGWANAGFGDGVEAVDGVILPYTGAWALVRHGTVELDAASANMLVVALGGAAASDGVLVPIVLRERLAAVLYADRRSADHELAAAALQVLTYAATQALETLPLRVGYAASLASALDREQEEPLTAWEEAAVEPGPIAPDAPPATATAAALTTFAAAALVAPGLAEPTAAEVVADVTLEEEPVTAYAEVQAEVDAEAPAEEAIAEPTAAEPGEPAEPDVSTWETGEQPLPSVEPEVPVAAVPEDAASEALAVTEAAAAITAIEATVEEAAVADSEQEDLAIEEPSVTAELATELPLPVEPEPQAVGDELTAAAEFTLEAARDEQEEPAEAGFALGIEGEEVDVAAVEPEGPAWSLEAAQSSQAQEPATVAAYPEATWETPAEPEAVIEPAGEEPLAEPWAEASEIELAPADEPVVEEELAAEAPTRMLPAFEAEPLASEGAGEPEQGEDTLLTSRPRTSEPSLAAPPMTQAEEESPNATMMWSVPATPDFEPELAAPLPPTEAPPPLPPVPADQPAAVAPPPPPETAEASEAAPRPDATAVASPPPGRGGDTVEVRPPEDLTGPGWAFATTRIQTMGRDPAHEEAHRLARLLVSEIKLYNEELVEEGRRMRNIYGLLREDIDRSRQMFEERIDPKVRAESDYFQQELVRILAGGDAGALLLISSRG